MMRGFNFQNPWVLLTGICLCLVYDLQSQPVEFRDASDRLNQVAGFATFSDCVVDMNGDFLDDVVRVGEKGLFIDYQQHDGSFIQAQFNFSIQAPPRWSIAAGDLDNNGYNDLLLGHSSSVSFIMANDHGTGYEEMLMPEYIESQRSTIADFNNDGWLDALICNEASGSIPYLNQGDGTMVFDTSVIRPDNRPGNYAAIWTDYDLDNDIDLYISKCLGGALPGDIVRTNLLYRNNGDGSYTEVAAEANLDDNAQSWSTVFEDFDHDGDFDAFIVNHDFANRLFRNNGNGTFTDVIELSGIDPFDLGAFENASGDFNNDGHIDIFSELLYSFYLSNGDMTFVGQESPVLPGGIGDLNNDGHLDVLNGSTLWMNEGNKNHWLKISLRGIESNLNGIGSKVILYGSSGQQVREVRSGQSYSPMNSLSVYFGMGTDTDIDSAVIQWPSGITTRLNTLVVDTHYIIPEASCLLPAISLDINGPVGLCAGEAISISGPDGFERYQWSNGDTSRFGLLEDPGLYHLLAADSNGCLAISQWIEIYRVEDRPPEITTLYGTTFCAGDTVRLISSPGENYRWSNGEILTQTIEVASPGAYSVSVDALCFDGQLISDTVYLDMIAVQAPIPQTVYALPGDSVLLMAEGENIFWYDAPAGGTLLHTGNNYQTGELDNTTIYYLESHSILPAQLQSGGKMDTTGSGGLSGQSGHLIFEAWEPFILDTVSVYVPVGGPQGIRFIQVYTDDVLIASKQFIVHEGLNVLPLGFPIPVGTHILTTLQGNLFRNEGSLDYPYGIGDVGEIVTSSNGEGYYYYFYDWKITRPSMECISERVPFEVIVSAIHDESAEEFIIYPNPADEILFLVSNAMEVNEIRMYGSDGREYYISLPEWSTGSISMSNYPAGSYWLKIIGRQQVQTFKVIIQH